MSTPSLSSRRQTLHGHTHTLRTTVTQPGDTPELISAAELSTRTIFTHYDKELHFPLRQHAISQPKRFLIRGLISRITVGGLAQAYTEVCMREKQHRDGPTCINEPRWMHQQPPIRDKNRVAASPHAVIVRVCRSQ